MSAGDRVREVIEPLLGELGLEVVDVEHSGATLRVTIDRAPEATSTARPAAEATSTARPAAEGGGGIDLDTVARASEVVSAALDRADPIAGRYTLEVSSPGIERPLRTPAHFRAHLGATVAVKTRPGADGDRRVEGTLEAADDDAVTVAGRALAYRDIERAHTVFTWGRSAKKSTKKRAS